MWKHRDFMQTSLRMYLCTQSFCGTRNVRTCVSGTSEMPEATSLSDVFEHHRSGSSMLLEG